MLKSVLVLLSAIALCRAGNLTLYAVAVGQGDCNVIQCPNGQDILIVDMGAKDRQYASHEYVTDLLKTKFRAADSGKRIHMVISHSHIDHYNYITSVMDTPLVANVQQIILGDTYSKYGASFRSWLDDNLPGKVFSVNNEKSCFGNAECAPTPVSGQGKSQAEGNSLVGDPWQFCGSDVKITALGANIGTTQNSRSIVMKLVFNQWSLFMAGDFEMVTPQKALLTKYPNGELKSTYYKVAHHGAWTSKQPNLPLLLAAIQPKRVYVSQAYPNVSQFHHPNCQTIKNLQDIGSIETINKNSNAPFVCWDDTKVVTQSGMGMAIYETCRSYAAGSQVCEDVWVESNGVADHTQYLSVPGKSRAGDQCDTSLDPWSIEQE